MPTFTISKGGQTLNSLKLDGDRIELGSANTCEVFIDDLLVSLKQAVLIRTDDGYRIEPLARTPSFTLNGVVVEDAQKVPPGAIIAVEGYEIKVEMEPVAGAPPPPSEPADVNPPQPVSGEDDLPPLPPPLTFDDTPAPVPAGAPVPSPPPLTQPSSEEKTVYVAKAIGQVVAIAGPLQGKSWILRAGEIRIGRDQAKNDIVIRADVSGNVDKSISRRHASIHVDGSTVLIEDQNSVAGTFVNGRQVPPGQRIAVTTGDQIEIRSSHASTVFRVELEGDAISPAPAPPLPSAGQPEAKPWAPPYQEPRQEAPPEPRYEPPPPPPEEPEGARRRRRRDRGRPAFDDNLFAPGAELGLFDRLPKWIWFVAAGAVLLIIIVLLSFR